MSIIKPSPTELYSSQLKTYGLEDKDIAILKLSLKEDVSGIKSGYFSQLVPTPGIIIPYFDPFTGAALTAAPKWPAFYRVRLLGEFKWKTGFGQVPNRPEVPPKYLNETGIGVAAYFPPNIFPPSIKGGWKAVLSDPKQPLIITEGEFKAARACKAGYPTIALGGVYNTHSNELGQQESLLPELLQVNWIRRKVYICFDSDYRTNPNVGTALQRIADKLQAEGAICMLLSIPEPGGDKKAGLDDYINEEGAAALGELIKMSDPLGMAKELFNLNDQYVQAEEPAGILDIKTFTIHTVARFKENYSEERFVNRIYNPKSPDAVTREKVALGPAWLKWEMHRKVKKLVYYPTNDNDKRTVFEQDGISSYNMWSGWKVIPKKGNAKPFLDHMAYLFTDTPQADLQWLLRWLAYPLQNPGAKMLSSVVIIGRVQGTGKSTIGYTMERIYGLNFSEIRQKALTDNFNEWAVNRQFVMCDDVTGWNKREDADMFKNMITQQSITIKRKYVPEYTLPAVINYMWTTNRKDAFQLEDTDRRFFIHEIKTIPRPLSYYQNYYKWLDKEGGAAIVFDYLLNLDLGDFDPHHHAMSTAAKDEMRELSRTDLDAWVHDLLDAPDAYLKIGDMPFKQELVPIDKILACYLDSRPYIKTAPTAQALAIVLGQAGAVSVARVRRSGNNQRIRAYAIRNLKKWEKYKDDYPKVKEYLEKHWSGS